MVRNKGKLVYKTVGEWLEGNRPPPEKYKGCPGSKKQLRLQNDAAQLLRKYRREQGALEFDTLEAEVVMENGEIRGWLPVRRTRPGIN